MDYLLETSTCSVRKEGGCAMHSSNPLTVSVARFSNMSTSFWLSLAIPTPLESHRYLPAIQPHNRLDR